MQSVHSAPRFTTIAPGLFLLSQQRRELPRRPNKVSNLFAEVLRLLGLAAMQAPAMSGPARCSSLGSMHPTDMLAFHRRGGTGDAAAFTGGRTAQGQVHVINCHFLRSAPRPAPMRDRPDKALPNSTNFAQCGPDVLQCAVVRSSMASGRLEETSTLSPDQREKAMSFAGIANPVHLSILTGALDGYCRANRISDPAVTDDISQLTMALFGCGASTAEELEAALFQHRRQTHHHGLWN